MHAVDIEVNRRDRVGNPKKNHWGHAYNNITWEAEAGGSDNLHLQMEFEASSGYGRPTFKKKKRDIAEFGGGIPNI